MHANVKLWPFSKENLCTSVIHKAISQYLPHIAMCGRYCEICVVDIVR